MKKILLGLLGLLLVGVMLGYGTSWLLQQKQKEEKSAPLVHIEKKPVWEVQLYFTAPEGEFLVPEPCEIPVGDSDIDSIRHLLVALIAGSRQGNVAVLPQKTEILAVVLENDLVRINFSRQLVDFHPGGSLTELFTIYSLINSLTENFPYIRQLQIVVEGEVRQTLKGHVRIDQPIYADFSFNQPTQMGITAGTQGLNGEVQKLTIEKIIDDTGEKH